MGTGLLVDATKALAQSSSSLTAGDAAILRFLAAGEALEVDFWTQYNELAGIPDDEVSGGSGSRAYIHCLKKIDRNFPQYIHDNTDDEISHQNFLNAYLTSKGVPTADLEPFRTLRVAAGFLCAVQGCWADLRTQCDPSAPFSAAKTKSRAF